MMSELRRLGMDEGVDRAITYRQSMTEVCRCISAAYD